MLWRSVLALCVMLAPLLASHEASANGRPPGTSSIHFRRGMEQEIAAGMTFGLLLSRDNGATWSWMCEDAIGYGGTYDPDYTFATNGALFATTFTNMKVARDLCTFDAASGMTFVSTVTQGSDGRLYYGAAETGSMTKPGDAKIYRSTDGGMTWTPGTTQPGMTGDWWQTLEVAPSNPNRLYLSGFRFIMMPSGNIKNHLLFRSDDAGDNWMPLNTTQLVTAPNSTIEIAGISHTNPNLVYARVKLENNLTSDAIYRSTDGGTSWTRVLGKGSAISFLVRRSGELVAATLVQGTVRSTNDGTSWTDLVDPPHINCLAENSAGEVWACTQNFGGMQAPSDGYGIMKSRDLATWEGAMKIQQMKAPVACADGTVQRDTCDNLMWCGLCDQLGCQSGRPECDPVEAPIEKGCCKNSAAPAPGALLLMLGAGVLMLRPRRRRSAR